MSVCVCMCVCVCLCAHMRAAKILHAHAYQIEETNYTRKGHTSHGRVHILQVYMYNLCILLQVFDGCVGILIKHECICVLKDKQYILYA